MHALQSMLAHGAGAPIDSESMTAATAALVAIGFRVARFELDYMASRRTSVFRKPPPKAEKLIPEYRSAIESLDVQAPLIIGDKSMGDRVASMIADEYTHCHSYLKMRQSKQFRNATSFYSLLLDLQDSILMDTQGLAVVRAELARVAQPGRRRAR